MCVIFAPVSVLNSSPAQCCGPPGPADAYDSGLFFDSSMSSLTVFAGTLGCTARIMGIDTSMLTGMKSFTGSKDNWL
jgi:hypothetical protein